MHSNLGFHNDFPKIELINDDLHVMYSYKDFKKMFAEEKVDAEYQIWEFKVGSKKYLLSIRDKLDYLHLQYPLEKMQGEHSTRKKALRYFGDKYGDAFNKYSKMIAVCSYSPFRREKSKGNPLKIRYRSIEDLLNESRLNTSTNDIATIPAIRLLPMSETDPEFTGKSIEFLQEWFVNVLPNRKYNFKKGMNTDSGTLVLFQYQAHVIASAILEKKIRYDEEKKGGYKGAYSFIPESIAVFTPITSEEIKVIWGQFKGFNQSLQELDVNMYELLSKLLLSKNIRYVLDKDIDEETFQKEIVKTNADCSNIVIDKPKEINKWTHKITPLTKWKRNPIVSRNAIILAKYRCEYDESHIFFKSNTTGENYVEAHHLIPMEFQDQFENSLDVEANIFSLCPLCHKKVHHAVFEEKEDILIALYEERISRLEKCGIKLTKENLLNYYK
ncbi:hypothetical protein NST63_15370 [Heyndrickxia sp. FSL W8-0496]|uniref:HNH endonuclease n=1 Tax=Heyndrickxia TaxID=2837504 RepID=UPI0030F91AF8